MSINKDKKIIPKWLLVITILFTFILTAFKSCVYSFHLSLVPDGMGIWRVTYSEEKTMGLGPGGNEAGIIVYALPEKAAIEIQKEGLAYFQNLPVRSHQPGDHRRGIYTDWKATPMDAEWVKTPEKQESTLRPYTVGIASYLNIISFDIPLDAKIEKEINDSISRTGNYYAYGRYGIIIVVPNIRKVFYVYSG